MEKSINTLRTFFRLSNAVFNFQNNVQLITIGYISKTKMQQLHEIALEEIEKENPDLNKIDRLLQEMELLTN